VPVGPYLADQLLLPLGICAWHDPPESRRQAAPLSSTLSEGGTRASAYRTLPLTGHSKTHIELIREFLGVTITVEEAADGNYTITVGSCALPGPAS
jgi:RNA 3'-terminal phosphate cyclase (ATP)